MAAGADAKPIRYTSNSTIFEDIHEPPQYITR